MISPFKYLRGNKKLAGKHVKYNLHNTTRQGAYMYLLMARYSMRSPSQYDPHGHKKDTRWPNNLQSRPRRYEQERCCEPARIEAVRPL